MMISLFFKIHTMGISSKLLKRMGCQGKCFGVNVQGIINPTKVEELPRRTRIGYVIKEVGECAETTSEPPTTNDEKPSSVLSKLTKVVKYINFLSLSSSHIIIYVGDFKIPIISTNMRLLILLRSKEEIELGINNKGITQPLEVM